MPLIDSPADNIARIYARSLIQMASQHGGREGVEAAQSELEDILEIARADPRFSEFLASRVVPPNQRAKSLDAIFTGKVSDLTRKFLQILNKKGRLSHLPAISAAFDSMVQEQFGRVEIDVFTAEPLAADALRSMRERLTATMKKDVVLYPYTEASMIGGVKFRIGDQLIDASVATRLRQLRDQIERDGAAKVRGVIDLLVDTSDSTNP